MDTSFSIPSHAERAHSSQRETHVEVTLVITGGAIPEDEKITLVFHDLMLDKPGQLEVVTRTDEEDELKLLSEDEGWRYTPQHHVTLNIDKALVPRQNHDGQIYTLRASQVEPLEEPKPVWLPPENMRSEWDKLSPKAQEVVRFLQTCGVNGADFTQATTMATTIRIGNFLDELGEAMGGEEKS